MFLLLGETTSHTVQCRPFQSSLDGRWEWQTWRPWSPDGKGHQSHKGQGSWSATVQLGLLRLVRGSKWFLLSLQKPQPVISTWVWNPAIISQFPPRFLLTSWSPFQPLGITNGNQMTHWEQLLFKPQAHLSTHLWQSQTPWWRWLSDLLASHSSVQSGT